MTNLRKTFGIIFVAAIIACALSSCWLWNQDDDDEEEQTTQTTQAQTLSVVIIGTPEVGKQLTADVQKNFSGEIKYEWYRNGQIISNERWSEYSPEMADIGKVITVKVTCGGKSAVSKPVTIQTTVAYTVEIIPSSRALIVGCRIGDNLYRAISEYGFSSAQWLRNGSTIPGETGEFYELKSEDVGKKIQCRVSGYGKTVTSGEFLVPATMFSKYIGNFEDIHMAKLTTPWKRNGV